MWTTICVFDGRRRRCVYENDSRQMYANTRKNTEWENRKIVETRKCSSSTFRRETRIISFRLLALLVYQRCGDLCVGLAMWWFFFGGRRCVILSLDVLTFLEPVVYSLDRLPLIVQSKPTDLCEQRALSEPLDWTESDIVCNLANSNLIISIFCEMPTETVIGQTAHEALIKLSNRLMLTFEQLIYFTTFETTNLTRAPVKRGTQFIIVIPSRNEWKCW